MLIQMIGMNSGRIQEPTITPVFDPSTIFTESRTGDYWEPSGWYQDDSYLVPADQSGDLILRRLGSRTTGTAQFFNQSTVGSRPAVVADATHGLVTQYLGASGKAMLAALSMNTPILTNGGTICGRIYVAAETNVDGRGHAIICSSSSIPEKGLCVVSRTGDPTDTVYFGEDTSTSGGAAETVVSPYLGQWISVVAKITSQADDTISTLYINDPDIPVATQNLSAGGLILGTTLACGHTSPYTSLVLEYKSAIIDEIDTPVSDWMSWLEA